MEWFSQKTSIAGVQIPNWAIVLGAVVVNLLIYSSMHRAVQNQFGGGEQACCSTKHWAKEGGLRPPLRFRFASAFWRFSPSESPCNERLR